MEGIFLSHHFDIGIQPVVDSFKKSKEIISIDKILNAGEEKTSFDSKLIFNSSYGTDLKSLGDSLKNLKF